MNPQSKKGRSFYPLTVAIILLLNIMACTSSQTASDTEQPNIVLIITDDQGWGDLGFHGNPDIKTPVLDAFAENSTRFTSFYVSPVCAPTRSSLMTGRYSLRTGVFDTYNGGAIMATEELTIAEILKEAGYRTGAFGKWHLGDSYPSRPMEQGFDQSLIHRSGGMAQVGDVTTYFRYDSAYFDAILLENGAAKSTKGYCSDVFTDAAIEFMKEQKDQPFFTYLSFNAPHTPLQLPQQYEDMYADLEFDSTAYPESERAFPAMTEKDKADARKVYGMVTNIDDNVGRVLSALEELNIREETLVIFMTDNGPQQRRYVGGFRGSKGTVYEGGIRVPCFMQYPNTLPTNKAIETPAAHLDLLPTILDICKLDAPGNVDGKSLLPLVKDEAVTWSDRPLFFYWQRGFPGPYHNVAVRKGDYKLVGFNNHLAAAEELELYNIKNDPSEVNNLSSSQTAIAEDLKNEFDNWYKEIIQSEHLGTVRIGVGSDMENPVILNRNDARGSWGIWAEDEVFGYWDVNIEQAGVYNFKAVFKDSLANAGRLSIRAGTRQASLDNEQVEQALLMENIWLPEGPCRIEAVYREKVNWQRRVFPFYLEVERI